MIHFAPTMAAQLGFFSYIIGAIGCTLAAIWIVRFADQSRLDRSAAVVALAVTALWCALSAALGSASPVAMGAESARSLAWLFLLLRLFANDGRDESVRTVRWLIGVLAVVVLLEPLALFAGDRANDIAEQANSVMAVAAILRMLVAIGALVLLHNLYAGAANSARQLLRWSAAASASLWAYDLNLYAFAYFAQVQPEALLALRGIVTALIAWPLAIGTNSFGAELRFKPSRKVTFQSLSLIFIGGYLLLLLVLSRSMNLLGEDLARITQVSLLVVAALAAILLLPSRRFRGWLRVLIAKHLFKHRYDYREEWLRFTRTIGRGSSDGESLHERAVKALADITESASGILLMPDEEAELRLAARWQWADLIVPAHAANFEFAGMLEQEDFILDLDELRSGVSHHGEDRFVPQWLLEEQRAWAVVPLIHFERLVGVVVLARPAAVRPLDWEDFDLLRVTGRQLASYLAEQAGQQALMESSRFEEFNRRIAFVMHDIKNLASQLSLLSRNAEKHADNPDFRADMLVTLRNSADKLNALLARLGRYGAGEVKQRSEVELSELARAIIAQIGDRHRVQIVSETSCTVIADREALEQALMHIVHNALDASEEGQKVFLEVSCDDKHGRLDVVDSGCGMTPGFVSNGLFKPFVSSKNGGFGIGAFEARELIRAMGGQLLVESREAIGTRFSVQLPLASGSGANAKGPAQIDEVG